MSLPGAAQAAPGRGRWYDGGTLGFRRRTTRAYPHLLRLLLALAVDAAIKDQRWQRVAALVAMTPALVACALIEVAFGGGCLTPALPQSSPTVGPFRPYCAYPAVALILRSGI